MAAKTRSDLGTGLFLIALGLIFLAMRQHLLSPIDLSRMWPFVLIVLGFGRLMARAEDGRHWGGLTTILIGVIFLLHTYRIFTLDQSWPLFIVVGGLSIVVGSIRRRGQLGTKP
jgi:hypothetical protein